MTTGSFGTPSSSPDESVNTEQDIKNFLIKNIGPAFLHLYFDKDTTLSEAEKLANYKNDPTLQGKVQFALRDFLKKNLDSKKKAYIDADFSSAFASVESQIAIEAEKAVQEAFNIKNAHIAKWESWFEYSAMDSTKRSEFENAIATLKLEEIKNSGSSPAAMRDFYVKKKGVRPKIFEQKAIADVLGGLPIDISKIASEDIDEIKEARDSGVFPAQLMEKLFDAIDTSSSSKQDGIIKIIQRFMPVISVGQLRDFGVLSLADIEQLKQDLYKDFCNQQGISLPAGWENSDEMLRFNGLLDYYDWQVTTKDLSINFHTALVNGFVGSADFQERLAELIDEHQREYKESLERLKDAIANFAEFKDFLLKEFDNLDDDIKAKLSTGRTSLENLQPDDFIATRGTDGSIQQWKISEIDKTISTGQMGLNLMSQKLEISGGAFVWKDGDSALFSYKDFIKNFFANLSQEKTEEMLVQSAQVPPPDYMETSDIMTRDQFDKEIDAIDEQGEGKPLVPGMVFAIRTSKGKEFVTVDHIDDTNRTIRLRTYDGNLLPASNQPPLSWKDFVNISDTKFDSFRRLGKIDDGESFAKFGKLMATSGSDDFEGFSNNLLWENGKMLFEDSDLKKNELWGFKNPKTGTFVEVSFFDGKVTIQVTEFKSDNQILKEQDKDEKKSKEKDKKKKQTETANYNVRAKVTYKAKEMSYASLLQFLQEKDAKEVVGENDAEDQIDEYEKDLKLQQGEDLKGKKGNFGGITLGSVWYMMQNTKKVWDDYWDTRSKVSSAYAFIKMPAFLGVAGVDAMAQVIDGEVSTIKKKYSGVDRRKYIADTIFKDGAEPRPHEVLACLMLVYEMSGTLYPDSHLQELQGKKYIWFEKVCQALGLNPGVQMVNCRGKVIDGKPEIAEHPPEEELIERLFKANQDNKMVQAIGGGAKVWKMATKGRQEQQTKGEEEVVKEASTISGRADYMMAKFGSNEFEIALGAFSKVLAMGTSVDQMGVMVAYVLGGAPNYVHPSTSKLFGDMYYNGLPLHALLFCKTKEKADLYRKVFEIALERLEATNAPGSKDLLKEWREVKSKFPSDPFSHADRGSKDADRYKEIFNFWKKHSSILQPVMQGMDPTLGLSLEDPNVSDDKKNAIKAYWVDMGGGASYYLNVDLKKYPDNLGANNTYAPNNIPFFFPAKEGAPYKSISHLMSILGYDGMSATVGGANREVIFKKQVLATLDFLRTNHAYTQNPEVQKKQFIIFYKDIVLAILKKMGGANEVTKEVYEDRLNKNTYDYINLLKKYGFNVSYEYIFRAASAGDDEEKQRALLQPDAEEAWARYIQNGPQGVTVPTQERVNKIMSGSNNANFNIAAQW